MVDGEGKEGIAGGGRMNTPRTDFVAHESGEALEAALAEPEQEPIAWLVTYGGLSHVEYTQPTHVVDTHYQPLYPDQP